MTTSHALLLLGPALVTLGVLFAHGLSAISRSRRDDPRD